jgi:hypothetical protein
MIFKTSPEHTGEGKSMTTQDLVQLLLKRLDRQDEVLADLSRTLDEHIKSEDGIRPALMEMAEMWGRSKAVAWFFTKLASMIAILAGGFTWVKDHVK